MNDIDDGRSPSGPGSRPSDRAQEVAAVPASIPNALKDAVGNLVSMCADARDVFPDSQTALECVTEAVNELYGCLEDGAFGPVQAGGWPVTREEIADFCSAVLADNMPRHDEPYRTIAYYINAGRRRAYREGLAQVIDARSGTTGTGVIGEADESPVAEGDAPKSSQDSVER